MFTADADGKNLRVIDPYNFTSHFIWEDEKHIVAWTKVPGKGFGFFRFEDAEGGKVEQVGKGVMDRNGHNTFIGSSEWILNDTYPDKIALTNHFPCLSSPRICIFNKKIGSKTGINKSSGRNFKTSVLIRPYRQIEIFRLNHNRTVNISFCISPVDITISASFTEFMATVPQIPHHRPLCNTIHPDKTSVNIMLINLLLT